MGFLINLARAIFCKQEGNRQHGDLTEEAIDMGCIIKNARVTSVNKYSPNDNMLEVIGGFLRGRDKPIRPYRTEDGSLYLGVVDWECVRQRCPYARQIGENLYVCQNGARIQQYLDSLEKKNDR